MVQMSRHRAHSILNVILLGLSILLTYLNLFGQDLYEQVSSTDKLIIQYPTVYAITNARIVTGIGQTIGNGSLVLKDGLIESVGSSIDVPAEAEVINADGMTVYPGFIDVHTALGFHPPEKRGSESNREGQQEENDAYQPKSVEYDRNLRPDKTALADIDFNDRFLNAARESGITTVLSVNRQGIFPGKGSVITTFSDELIQSLIKSSSYQFIQYSAVRGGYPNTPMGVIAFQRQTLTDASYYAELVDRFNRNGTGMRSPVFDPVLSSLFPVVRGDETIIIPVNTENEIKKAVQIAQNFNLNVILSGVVEGYRVVNLLKQANVQVIVSVNFPDPKDVTGYSFTMPIKPFEVPPPPDKEKKNDDDPPLKDLDDRIKAQLYGNAAALNRADISFVLSAGGAFEDSTSVYEKFLANVRHAIDAGLPESSALAAMTIGPAEMLGLDNTLGTVESGKMASLVITDGDLFDEDSKIRYVFIDGKIIDLSHNSSQSAEKK